MSDSESFAARWSRLKRATVKGQQEAASPETPSQLADATAAEASPRGDHEGTQQNSGPPPVDPESLPPIESLNAASDIKPFLQAGVPKDLTLAALRRVWTADPAIRDFIGLAENQWDFTDPTAMPGFGPLEATDDVRQLVHQAMGRLGELTERPDTAKPTLLPDGARAPDCPAAPSRSPDPLQAQETGQENASYRQQDIAEENQLEDEVAAPQHVEVAEEVLKTHNRRAHGGALPR